MKIQGHWGLGLIITAVIAAAAVASPAPMAAAPTVPTHVTGKAGVKAYLTKVIEQVNAAAADLKHAGVEYDRLATAAGSPTAAAKAHPQQIADLIHQMRDAYERIDSYGYEYVEGIVAGVPSLIHYDVELDSGVPRKGAGPQDNIADLVIHAGNFTVDHEGSLNNWLIEPTVYGTNPQFTDGSAALPGFDKPVHLPRPRLVIALADYALDAYGRLGKDAAAWQPTDADCFHILANMTPTLADYFDEWKESKKNGYAPGGRFVAVSRVSDMRGIMSSTRLAWLAMASQVGSKDEALAQQVSMGYDQILRFIDIVDAHNQKNPLKIQTIDALGAQAKERADKLTVQATQAAALMGFNVNGR